MKESRHITLNKKKWDRWSERADGKGRVFDYLRNAQKRLLELADIKENVNLLDIGCGTGWALGQAAIAVNYKGSFYGVDLSEGMIEKARANFAGNPGFHFIVAGSDAIPLADNRFEIIICSNSFHHYLHPQKAMKEISRLLRKGG
jgi:ubiquinone/menaquinone biosynthesis C-methylase UbiE